MPRHTRRISTNANHRNTRSAQREHRRAVAADLNPFGIRRELSDSSEVTLMDAFTEISDAGILPDIVRQRGSLHVTHLPVTFMLRYMSRGVAQLHELSCKMPKIQNQLLAGHTETLPVLLGDACIFKGGKVGYRIINEALYDEHEYLMDMLKKEGLKGTLRDKSPLHVTLAETRGLKRSQQYALVGLLDKLLYREFDEDSETERLLEQFDVREVDDLPMVPEKVVLDPVIFYDNK